MIAFFSRRNAHECLLGGLLIFAVSLGTLKFYAIAETFAVPLWPDSGVALALLLLRGWRLFPAITLGTFAATSYLGFNHIFSVAGCVGNTLESLIGWFLMRSVFGFSNSLASIRDILVLMLAGAPWGTLLNSIICTLGLVAAGKSSPSNIPLSSLLFWSGNLLGILVFTPLVLRFRELRRGEGFLKAVNLLPGFLLFASLSILLVLGFTIRGHSNPTAITLIYLTYPLLIFGTFRFRLDIVYPLAFVTVLSTAFTVMRLGPLIEDNPLATFAHLSVYIAMYSLSCLIQMGGFEEKAITTSLALETRLRVQRHEAEIRSIRTNLNPHFLFNSLNTIKSLISEDAEKARRAVVALSGMLRASLRMTRAEFVPLREELSVIRSYLDLQKMRHEDRMICDIEESCACDGAPVPPMLFHQLVENAVKHGAECSDGVTSIRVGVACSDDLLTLRVENTGKLRGGDEKTGVGIASIREELAVIYNGRASFSLTETGDGKVLARITLPRNHPSPSAA